MSACVIGLLMAVAGQARAADTIWPMHIIGGGQGTGGLVGADGARLGDVNGDGFLDITVGFEGSSATRVYMNPGPTGNITALWDNVTVGSTPNVEDAFFADIDGDGRLDVITSDESGSGGSPNGKIRVHYAPTTGDLLNASNWTTQLIPAATAVTEWMYGTAMQIDGQYGLDLVVAGKNHNQGTGAPTSKIGWLRAPADPRNDPNGWQYFNLDNVGWVMSVINQDMDADGDLDVLLSDRRGSDASVRWLENPTINPNGKFLIQPWTPHVVHTANGLPSLMTTADLNGDGMEDIIVPTLGASDLFWYERLDNTGDNWTVHEIAWPTNFGEGKAVEVADVNLDGQLDIVISSSSNYTTEPGLVWLEHEGDPTATNWIRHDLSGPGTYGKYDLVQMLDVDGDGDLDVITTEEQHGGPGFGVVWFENPTPAPTLTGDLNGDGFVGQDDLNLVLGNWGQNVTPGDPLQGDPSGDGFVGQDDLNQVLSGWGQGTPLSLAPEPGAASLLGVCLSLVLCRRSRR